MNKTMCFKKRFPIFALQANARSKFIDQLIYSGLIAYSFEYNLEI